MSDSRQQSKALPLKLRLLGGFDLFVNGAPVTMQIHAQRVLAYLSLAQPAHVAHARTQVAERLWSEVSVQRSHASLRSALWCIRRADERLVHASRSTIRLDASVDVDVRRCVEQAGRLLTDASRLQPRDLEMDCLRGDLLPGWEEDWLLLERERIRLVQIQALEALARRLCLLGRHHAAIDAAFAAMSAEPLRESANAALIDIFLAEHNVALALRQFERYAALLWAELRIKPSAELARRVVAAQGRYPATTG